MITLQKIFFFTLILTISACSSRNDNTITHEWTLKASAYNSLQYQTQGDPTETAWGDRLKPGMKCIAISRDLLDSGWTHNTKVYIPKLKDTFVVNDKMNMRFKKKIDIYFGNNIDSAREFGVQKLKVIWKEDTTEQKKA